MPGKLDSPPFTEMPLCQICLEESASQVLSNCNHNGCKSCLTKWIEREEKSGQTNTSTCPFCRIAINAGDVFSITGRSFQPRRRTTNEVNEDEIDELTLQWLHENTVVCEGCGSSIEKESGCDLIECLCGWRFCYSCGSPGGTCDCNRGHVFLNASDYIADEPVRINGIVSIGHCVLRREKRRDRQLRIEKNIAEEAVHWAYTKESDDTCTINGKWIFSSKKNSITILMQQMASRKIRSKRGRQEIRKSYDYLLYFVSRENLMKRASVSTSNGRWLFSSTNSAKSVKMLTQQLRFCRVSFERVRRSKMQNESQPKYNMDLSWLFPVKQVQVKRKPSPREMARKHKHNECRRRWEYSKRNAALCSSNGRWLFSCKTNGGSMRMLTQQMSLKVHRNNHRQRTRKSEALRWAFSEKRAAICTCNGRWLYSFRQDIRCLRMLNQQLRYVNIRRARIMKKAEIREEARYSFNDATWLFPVDAE
mmetsp:Transcript_16647/g.21427  ORF Transcript_16647/g.21427 Transcript_16647/m.21427 type:complete len:478 (-) Transcript_16647:164-1597(-)